MVAAQPVHGLTSYAAARAVVDLVRGEVASRRGTTGLPARSVSGYRHVLVALGRDDGDVTPLKGVYSSGSSQLLGVVAEVTRLQ